MKEKVWTSEVLDAIASRHDRSAWNRGVAAQAYDMVEELIDNGILTMPTNHDDLLGLLANGADSWVPSYEQGRQRTYDTFRAYSRNGCALIYDTDIAERYCTPSFLKRKHGGNLPPSSTADWMDVQADGCLQAFYLIAKTVKALARKA